MVEHKFFKEGEDWFIRCPITGGNFAVDIWKDGSYPKNCCPCCECDISQEIKR